MSASYTISNKPAEDPSLDYALLRQEGLRYLERVNGSLWTDYNSHDPGITILEVLCYAITELGYRASLPIESLIADGEPNTLQRHFLTAANILPVAPVTRLDYRKLLLDVPGVKNAWLIPNRSFHFDVDCTTEKITTAAIPSHHSRKAFQLKGIFDILVQPDESITEETNANRKKKKEEALIKAVRRTYHAHRNLGEDLAEVTLVPMHDIRVCADIELHPQADIESVYAQIYYQLQLHFNPAVRRYTLAEMQAKGLGTEKIYEGPLLSGGFVDDLELKKSDLKKEIRLSDIIRVIMDIPGVKLIQKIHINDCAESLSPLGQFTEEHWLLPVKPGFLPNLCEDKSRFKFYKGLLPFEVDRARIQEIYNKLVEDAAVVQNDIANSDKNIALPELEKLNTEEFSSIQNDLPQAYGVGQHGTPNVPDTQRTLRQAQSKQLRAYLLFYDQILADFMSQLANIRTLFQGDQDLGQSYFHQVISDLPNIAEAYQNYTDLPQSLVSASGELKPDINGSSHFDVRGHRILDHLMARFSENFNDYVLQMHSLTRRRKLSQDILADKRVFFKEYAQISRDRFKAMDIYNRLQVNTQGAIIKDALDNAIPKHIWYDPTNSPEKLSDANIAGIVHRVSRQSGIFNVLQRNLAKIFHNYYEEIDTDTTSELRFRVIDTDREKILLSSSKHFNTREAATEELRLAVRLAASEDNYQLLTASNGRFYFNIIDRSKNDVIARRIEYFVSETARADAIAYLTQFIRRNLSEEGMFVVEHHLLRPMKKTDPFLPVCCSPDCDDCGPIDPYSYRVHIVLPGYAPRFQDMDFRAFFEQNLRMELPAHLLPKICWIGKEQMGEFESRYKDWLEVLQKQSNREAVPAANDKLKLLLEILGQLYTIYPEGYLHDCKDDGDERNPVILGRTQIGTL